ncbi:hypothetical protein SAMN04489761_3461 [Tenacibaculum sp. MAR_2009_124]|uniref:hypothetical protein n=1 Tax=Tenacibaculum sp. MAR_2009_124 TaxID=1250059 RepID=UPI00089D9890|nr:hypothetical protein [Tenacibaculum sp. MAR_2009_124]SEC67166.1 hypothetical protein SAMN04489761_3461 [Tenacibaculum sp. MAR_2009_124]
MTEFRKAYIKHLLTGNEYLGFFHKWFDGHNDDGRPTQFAIMEKEDGTIIEISLDIYQIRFFTQKDIDEENSKGWEKRMIRAESKI